NNCSSLTSLDLSAFDTSNVVNMSSMFYNCERLKTIYVSSLFQTDNVSSSSGMFSYCSSLAGEAGTAYNSSYTGVSRARVDGGASSPGYFTYKAPGNVHTLRFDANGGSVGMTAKSVTNGSAYGELPAPVWSGYSFDGWYTEAEGGDAVTKDMIVRLTEDQTLFAHWSSELPPLLMEAEYDGEYTTTVTIRAYEDFEFASLSGRLSWPAALGGSIAALTAGDCFASCAYRLNNGLVSGISTDSAFVPEGEELLVFSFENQLPAGSYVFSFQLNGVTLPSGQRPAWGNASVDCELYVTPSITPGAAAFFVSFHPNGGEVAAAGKSVTNGNPYGALPVPTREGYVFEGWYTAAGGGELVTAGTIFTLRADQTLYARWQEDNARLPRSVSDLSYSFGNTVEDFAYFSNYQPISTERYAEMGVQDAFDSQLLWTGNDFGMAATAGLLFDENYAVYPEQFRAVAARAGELAPEDSRGSLSLKDFIEQMQVSRYTQTVQTALADNGEAGADALVRAVRSFWESGHGPVVTVLSDGLGSTHALLGYALEDADGGSAQLRVYDPDYPNEDCRISLTLENGSYTGWEYSPGKRQSWSSARGGSLSYVSCDTLFRLWDDRSSVEHVAAFTVRYHANGGSGGPQEQTKQAGQVLTLSSAVPTREGYEFIGWATDRSSGTVAYQSGGTYTRDADVMLYAVWLERIYTVSYDANGGAGAPAKQTKAYGRALALSTLQPTREDYSFAGWAWSPDASKPDWQPGGEYTSNASVTMYAVWEASTGEYTVSFDCSGETRKVKLGQAYGELPSAEKAGYTFQYWKDQKGSQITPETLVSIEGNHTLYAVWSGNSVKVTFKWNDGSDMNYKAPQEAMVGSLYGSIMPKDPERDGYRFEGWYTLPEGGTRIRADTEVATDRDHALHARWAVSSFAVTYEINAPAAEVIGAAPAAQTKLLGEALKLSPAKLARTGYEFMGWARDAKAAEAEFKAGGMYYDDAPAALYAVWSRLRYTVRYDANGGNGAPEAQIKEYGITLKLSGAAPIRSGSDFLGWAADKTAAAVQYKPGDEYTLNSPLTLYAVWQRSPNARKARQASDLSYAFTNSLEGFGYISNIFSIAIDIFHDVFGRTQRAENYFSKYALWKGNCFGMAGTAGFLFEENEFLPQYFSSSASLANQLKLNDAYNRMTVKMFIEQLQVCQYAELVQMDLSKNSFYNITAGSPAARLNAIVAAVKNFESTGHDPVIVAIYGPPEWGLPGGGHALLGYRVEDADADTAYLWVYDPNYPNESRAITLTRQGADYTGWKYSLAKKQEWSSANGGHISYVPYEDLYAVWNGRGEGLGLSMVTVNQDVEILDGKGSGSTLAVVQDGSVSSNRTDIFQVVPLGVTLNEAKDDIEIPDQDSISFLVPAARYTVEKTQRSLRASDGSLLGAAPDLEITVTRTEQSATVRTEANSVVLVVDDAQKLNYVSFDKEDAGASYNVTLNSTLDVGQKNISMEGVVGGYEGTTLSQMGARIGIAGADDQATLKVSGMNDPIPIAAAGLGAANSSVPSIVSIDANGGEGSMSPIAVLDSDDELEAPACSLTKSGMRFSGWKLNGEERVYQPGEAMTVASDSILQAQWEAGAGQYALGAVELAGNLVTASVKNLSGTGAKLLAAAYDSGGRLLGCQTVELTLGAGAEAKIPVAIDTADAACVKVFILGADGSPLCPAVTRLK
ncbi:MAG: InlB B-repeat-containing protein, partial [Oscillospiraceae bacterium]|nr:InlB B-repeat-containing protein [Oscillospiraceae bacterium]